MVEPIVAIKYGKLQGKTEIDCCGGKYFSFRGIPYAKPPIGSLRFKAPLPPDPWTGLRDATKHGSECCFKDVILNRIVGSEDCLFLNVYTPGFTIKETSLMPVMFWIHGGGFTRGSGNSEMYGPDYLITQHVVVVTINYRIGLLGFLNFEDPSLDVPGNAGLKDQVMALRWVQENIAQFGGDPNNVTIFGESAGGASVHYLILSPLAKGLFHKAIMQSGTAISCWASGQQSLPLIKSALNTQTTNEKDVLGILHEMPIDKIIDLQEKIPDKFEASFKRPFCPVVENVQSKHSFLWNNPMDIIYSGNYNHVPIMIGFTSREGMITDLLNDNNSAHAHVIKDFETTIPHTMNIPKGSVLSKKVAKMVEYFYFGTEESSEKNRNEFFLLQGDNAFLLPLCSTIKNHDLTSSKPIYLYRMSIQTNLNIMKWLIQNVDPGVCHADDVSYLFKNVLTPKYGPNSIEQKTIKRFITLWSNFAKTGNPNPVDHSSLINIYWHPVDGDKLNYLDIGENLTVGINPEEDRGCTLEGNIFIKFKFL